MKLIKKIGRILLALLLIALLTVGGYVLYLQLNYYRIEDNAALSIRNASEETLKTGQSYTALSYNIGFGAYSPDYSFFMDKGALLGEKETSGKYGKGIDQYSVVRNTEGSLATVEKLNADFILLQEVDEKAHRSYFVNQVERFESALPAYGSVFAKNFHSGFLALPMHDMHGAVEAGLLTLSRFHIDSAMRKSLPVDNSFITKFFDLDRCLGITRHKVEGGKELVLINAHLSAYDEGGKIRKQQFDLLNNIILEEFQRGNYVIVGGDYNHALAGSKTIYPTKQEVPDWVAELNAENLNEHAAVVAADNLSEVPTCRACNIPYEKGVNYTVTVDGFLVTDNVEAKAKNIDAEFAYSDHNPVLLEFQLKE